MGENYNEILKEKKVYKEPVVSHKHIFFKLSLFIGVIVSLIVIGISYLVYYNTVLDSESILMNNILKLTNKYDVIFNNLVPDYNINDNYMLEGNIAFDNVNYSYSFIKDNGKIKRTFQNNDRNATYYYDNDLSYINVSRLGDAYVKVDNTLNNLDYYKRMEDGIQSNFYNYIYDSIFNDSSYNIYNRLYNIDNYSKIIDNIKTNFNTYISSDKYIKKFYLQNKEPIVEVNLILSRDDINNILGSSNNLEINDDYNISITMKNNAIDNEIKSIKIIINNKTASTREVISYQDDVFIYTDNDGNITKFVFNEKDDNFDVKIYKNDILYSVLSNTKEDKKSIYSYHIIDEIYSINLEFFYDDSSYNYVLETNIDNKVNKMEISGFYSKIGSIDLSDLKVVNYSDLNSEEKILFDKSIKEQLFGN